MNIEKFAKKYFSKTWEIIKDIYYKSKNNKLYIQPLIEEAVEPIEEKK